METLKVVEGPVGGFSLLAAVGKLVTGWESSTAKRRQHLLGVVDRKFGQLEATHALFMRLIDQAEESLEEFRNVGESDLAKKKNIRRLEERISAIESVRSEGRQTRLLNFQEARHYASEDFANRYAIIKSLPTPIIEQTKSMMAAYVAYFEIDGIYKHSLNRTLAHSWTLIEMLHTRLDGNGLHRAQDFVCDILREIQTQRCFLEDAWISASREYVKLKSMFADFGVF